VVLDVLCHVKTMRKPGGCSVMILSYLLDILGDIGRERFPETG
jgi:hypothetical protein